MSSRDDDDEKDELLLGALIFGAICFLMGWLIGGA